MKLYIVNKLLFVPMVTLPHSW